MMKSHRLSNLFTGRKLSAVALFFCVAMTVAVSASAVPITGVVTNGTTRQPAAGDRVVLIALRERMQEMAKTTTDAKGHFSIEATDPGMHLLRVDHQGATYFQAASPNTPNVDIQVYDVAKTVSGVTTEASALRIKPDPLGMHVSQTFFITNISNPPRTQFSDHSYEIYLPPGAKVDASEALGPERRRCRLSRSRWRTRITMHSLFHSGRVKPCSSSSIISAIPAAWLSIRG